MGIIRNFGIWLAGSDTRKKGVQSGDASITSNTTANVSTDTSLQISSVWACTRLIAETIASLPIKFYDIDDSGNRIENRKHPLHKLFSGKVNKWQTKQEYFETICYQFELHGNAYSVKQLNTAGEVIALIPLMSKQMEVSLDQFGEVVYRYTDENGNLAFYSSETIWHLKGMGNAIVGLSTLSYASAAIGIAQGADKATQNIYRNGGKTSGVLTIDKTLKPDQREAIKKNFSGVAEGNENRLFVLEAGMKFDSIVLSPQDIELLASRRFQNEEICRFFGVPPILVNDTQASTSWGSGIGQIVLGWYKLSLRPDLERIEASIIANLLPAKERLNLIAEFDITALLRADVVERMKMHKDSIQGGVVTPNEARKKEGLPPVEGGDEVYLQQQMTPINELDGLKATGSNKP